MGESESFTLPTPAWLSFALFGIGGELVVLMKYPNRFPNTEPVRRYQDPKKPKTKPEQVFGRLQGM